MLDPSCGCGNFLYVAYRELRGLEWELKRRIREMSVAAGMPVPALDALYYPITNVYGIDIENIAVLIARVTLWMGHRQMVDRYGPAEPVLPLVSLTNLRSVDALKTEWPEVDAIIGNPPFLGSQLLRKGLGDDYVAWLNEHFKVGVRDLCVYWFRKAEDHLRPGTRAGLVGTNSISQNRAREASLDYVTANGGVITDAVSSQKWPGDAKVHVSIVNWVQRPEAVPGSVTLDGTEVTSITTSLRPGGGSEWVAVPLPQNAGRAFQGPIPVGKGFIIGSSVAESLLADPTIDYTPVVRRYLVGDDIANRVDQSPSRWIIDFDQRALEQAAKFPRALEIVRQDVRPGRERVRRENHRLKWWIFGEPRVSMRKTVKPKRRYAAVGRVGKRLLVAWFDVAVCPSDLVVVFAFDDDYSMGVLMSRAHDAWAWAQSSTLETRLRYTPTSVFETFPWPDPGEAARAAVATAASTLYARRSELCLEHQLGLTKLYNLMDDGAFADLRELHRALDVAVAAAYGWPASVAQDPDELVSRLTELNRKIAIGELAYNPFNRADVTL